MSTTSMHFGPEWMRTKHQAVSRPQHPPSPPPSTGVPTPGASTYSALVSPVPPSQPAKPDEVHPFRYSKEEMLRIYREGGGKGGLGLEVERWEGVVREIGTEPVGLRDMGEAEKKLFAGPLNSDLRRRQSTDYLSPLSTQNLGSDRPRLNHSTSTSSIGSPMRERFGALMTRRRDSTDQAPTITPRKLSLSTGQPLMSPREPALPSPRLRTTPGFDGVLNGGDSWLARRRASEGVLKSTGPTGGEYRQDNASSEIREEDEGDGNVAQRRNQDRNDFTPSPQPNSSTSNSNSPKPVAQEPSDLNKGRALVHLEANGGLDGSSSPSNARGPPPGILDLASVEWSYLDPQGQIQGPFRADLMQKWHDDGYFTSDLLMKRTSLDTEWTAVGILARQSTGDKLFLSPPVPTLPPGLLRQNEGLQQGIPLPPDQNFAGPYQPSPTRNLRSATLDSFIGSGSNPSDSPASSFGGGRFSNGSPDPSAFGGRAGGNVAPSERIFPGIPGVNAPDNYGAYPRRSSTLADVSLPSASNTFSSPQSLWQTPSASMVGSNDASNVGRVSAEPLSYSTGFGSNGNLASTALGPGVGFGNQLLPRDAHFNGPSTSMNGGYQATNYNPLVDPRGQQPGSRLDNSGAGNLNSFNEFGTYGSPSQQQFLHSPSVPMSGSQQLSSPLASAYEQHGLTLRTHTPNQNPGFDAPASPWNTAPDASATRRPGPFDPTHPTSSNISVNRPITPVSPWGNARQAPRTAPQANDGSWPATSQAADGNWAEDPNTSLTFNNVGQHNQQQQQVIIPEVPAQMSQLPSTAAPAEVAPESAPIAPTPTTPSVPSKASKSVPQNQAKSAPKPSVVPVPKPVQNPPSPPPAAQPKPAWLKEEEAPKPSGVSLSLRDIQEAEAKKAEARKLAEREREKAARVAASATSSNEDSQPFIASWGLPTSQAGSRSQISLPRESGAASSPAATPTTPPVWTTTTKPTATKKTMKEIQEEEERRKKTASKETTAAIAARRAYAESANKSTPSLQGNAWSTVGPSGKATAAVTAPGRPTLTPSASAVSASPTVSSPRTNGASAARPAPVSAVVKAAPANSKSDDFPPTPSHDFLKWLNDSLRGLNSTVNVEEIMQMLLSFPMDPDPSTAEIISDLIYANSTTLDGRRFAAEFVSKRKSDVAARPKGAASSVAGATKTVSIADVVKAQPKAPASSEWGGFKVVNKKKKGGRS